MATEHAWNESYTVADKDDKASM